MHSSVRASFSKSSSGLLCGYGFGPQHSKELIRAVVLSGNWATLYFGEKKEWIQEVQDGTCFIHGSQTVGLYGIAKQNNAVEVRGTSN